MRTVLWIGILCIGFCLNAQSNEPKNWELNGYLKNMQSIVLLDFPLPTGPKELFLENLIHNRLNFKWYPSANLKFRMDIRNRIILGDFVELDRNYIPQLDQANDVLDLSMGYRQDYGLALHTMLDRLYMEYSGSNFEMAIGRQRINWGISSFWNPNDVFNSFSFVDFDHEERPGSDAFRFRRYFGFASHLEVAAKLSWEENKRAAALLWLFNAKEYDYQLMLGFSQEQLVWGGGWAGSIKEVGFKGEFSVYTPVKVDQEWSVTFTAGIEHVFKNNLMLGAGLLYVSEGTTDEGSVAIFNSNLDPKLLYPYKYSIYNSLSYSFNPLWLGSMTFVYSPSRAHPILIFPTVTFSLSQNWDLDFVSQLAFEKLNTYESTVQAFFIRIKWSF